MSASPVAIEPASAAAGVAARAMAIAAELEGPRQALEKAFLDMGERLMTCARLLREITSAHEAMPAELQSEEFADAVASMHVLRGEADRISGNNEANGAQLEALAGISDSLHGSIDNLNKAVRNLRLIAVNARIVAAGINSETGDFDSFALEMADLGRTATDIVAEFTESHSRLIATLDSAHAANRSFRTRHEGTLRAISERLAAQLTTIEVHKTRAAADAADSGRVARQISGRISKAVSALQIGDITRQRLEHIEDGLRDLGKENAGEVTAAAVYRLQLLQLDDASRNYSREVTNFANASRSLASDARLVLDDSHKQSEALLAEGGTALAGLVRDLQATMLLLQDFEAMRSELGRLRSHVAASVASMRERMEAIGDLAQSIRLLSINAAVRFSRLGKDGRALKVIAQEMRELAAHTVEAATTVTGMLRQTATILDSLGEPERQASDPTSLVKVAAAAADRLNQVIERLGVYAAAIANSGPKAANLLEDAAAVARNQEYHLDEWQAASETMREVAGDEHCAAGADPEFLARLRARYTMVGERCIHDDFCGALQEDSAMMSDGVVGRP